MPIHNATCMKDSRLGAGGDWVVSRNNRFRANIIVWGVPKHFSTLEVRSNFADLGLSRFVSGKVAWEGDHVRLILNAKDSKGLTKHVVNQVSASLRKIGYRCVLDDEIKSGFNFRKSSLKCVNRFKSLLDETCSNCEHDSIDRADIDLELVSSKVKTGGKERRRLRVATWNFSGLCSERKQKEVGELLVENNIDIVAGQESWEKEESRIDINGYKWFGKPRSNQNSQRGEGGVGFLVRECLVDEVECITSVKYEESMWMRICGNRGREALFVGCIYLPTESTSISVLDSTYDLLKEDVLNFKEKGKVVLLGDFNARVGKSVDIDDVIGMFGEDTCNASGNRLVSFLNEVELVACNGRMFVSEPEWTRVRPSLKQKSIIDYIITDTEMMAASGNVCVVNTDIGCSDHFLVWMELGIVAKRKHKSKRVIRRWRLDRFEDDEVKFRYENSLRAEVSSFSRSIRAKMQNGLEGHDLVNAVLLEWESIVNKVAKREVGEKMIVCGKAVNWWDNEIKNKIKFRRELYKEMINGREDLWDEYCRLRKEVKELVVAKKLKVWNEVVEKVNTDFDGNRKVFWSFVGRRTRSKKNNISSLKSETGASISSLKGKLEVLKEHYRRLGKMGVDSNFDDDWKELVENKLEDYNRISATCEDAFLDKKIERREILECIRKIKNNKAGGSDGLVGELLKYGGMGMVLLLEELFLVIWHEEVVPRQWREGLIINLFKKGDREDPGNYRGITLLSVVGKVFCKILNNRLVQCLDKEGVLHEGQAGFRFNRSCMDNIYTLNELIQGRIREDKQTYAFFLDIQKAYDTVWHNGLWYKLWDVGIRGKMWRVIKKMYAESRSVVFLEGEKSEGFSVEQGVAQGCSLSPILFSVFINDLLKEVEQAELGVQLNSGKRINGMLFADDFVGISDTKENLQRLIDVVYNFCNRWRLRANVNKSAVMVFSRNIVNGDWMWGERKLPNVSSYTYLGIDFSYNGAWDLHIKKVLDTGKRRVNQLHSIISNRDINLSARRLILLSVVRPSVEYGSEIWEGNKAKISALESIILKGAKKILGCSSKTCNEAVRGDMGLETLKSRRDRAKLKWWYKLVTMSEDRYAKQLFSQKWNIKPRRGRQRKMWSSMVDDIFTSLGIDKGEWLEALKKEESSLAAFMACVKDEVSERECREFEEGLNSKVKLALYKTFGKCVEFKKYLHGISDVGVRLLFKFRSGTHGLNEELGRHRGREGRSQCTLCGDECESVAHVLWDCPAYDMIRISFMEKLSDLLGVKFSEFLSLNSAEKTSFVLGSELWEDNFHSLLSLVKSYVVDVWELRKLKLYANDSCPGQFQSRSSAGNLDNDGGASGKLGVGNDDGESGKSGKFVHKNVHCVCVDNVCGVNDGSACCCGCVVYGGSAMAVS